MWHLLMPFHRAHALLRAPLAVFLKSFMTFGQGYHMFTWH